MVAHTNSAGFKAGDGLGVGIHFTPVQAGMAGGAAGCGRRWHWVAASHLALLSLAADLTLMADTLLAGITRWHPSCSIYPGRSLLINTLITNGAASAFLVAVGGTGKGKAGNTRMTHHLPLHTLALLAWVTTTAEPSPILIEGITLQAT